MVPNQCDIHFLIGLLVNGVQHSVQKIGISSSARGVSIQTIIYNIHSTIMKGFVSVHSLLVHFVIQTPIENLLSILSRPQCNIQRNKKLICFHSFWILRRSKIKARSSNVISNDVECKRSESITYLKWLPRRTKTFEQAINFVERDIGQRL